MTITSQYRGFCNKCHYTIWQGEQIEWSPKGKATHTDCLTAVADNTPRRINPKYQHIYGNISKRKLNQMIKFGMHGTTLDKKSVVGQSPTSAAKGGGSK